jgi:hypothetical protein
MRSQNWNVSAEYHTTVYKDDDVWMVEDDRPLSTELVNELNKWFNRDGEITVIIPFKSQGYYDPGICSGPPERCYPPEGEDERLLNGRVKLESQQGAVARVPLDPDVSQKFFDFFVEDIEEVKVNTEPEPPDFDEP